LPSRTFVLIVVDRDTGEFTVEGPMTDDRPWNKAVVDAQKVGRNIRCFGMGNTPPDAAAAEWQGAHGGRRIAAGSIVTASWQSNSSALHGSPPGRSWSTGRAGASTREDRHS
jgi:hypothetical protein